MDAIETSRRQAIRARDSSQDGRFFFGVVTTGIFCLPSCSSRPPRPENVRFFDTTEAAVAAGFRPCKRCRPADASRAERERASIERACATMRAAETMPTLAELAQAVGISRFHFHRLFKRVTGVTPKAFAMAHRLGRLRDDLAAGTPVADAVFGAGFGSLSGVYGTAPGLLGMTPGDFRKGGAGLLIRYAVTDTPIGWMLVAATGRGVCMVEFGNDPTALAGRVRENFGAAEIESGGDDLARWVERIAKAVGESQPLDDLPLDIAGTAFQCRVWRALRQIPLGAVSSYTEVAAAIGQPRAVRAVASACAANPVAIAVPCHRVVRSDGGLGGYHWGVERKAALLEREQQAATKFPGSEAE